MVGREMDEMTTDLRIKAQVQPGGKIEIQSPDLKEGQMVDIVVRVAEEPLSQSALEILANAPGHRVFKTAEEVKAYLAEDKAY